MNRVQIDIADDQLARIEELMRKCGVKTKKEFINNALTLLDWAINEREKGKIIASVDEDENRYKEVCLPIFSNLKQIRSLSMS